MVVVRQVQVGRRADLARVGRGPVEDGVGPRMYECPGVRMSRPAAPRVALLADFEARPAGAQSKAAGAQVDETFGEELSSSSSALAPYVCTRPGRRNWRRGSGAQAE